MKYKFLYRDHLLGAEDLERYRVGEVVHESEEVVTSFLRGGLLTNCNTRFLFITNIGGNFGFVSDDYRKQGLYIFESDLYYVVYDKYEIGSCVQFLLSPHCSINEEILEDVIAAAQVDFHQLLHTPPVQVLDTLEWRSRIISPIGKNGKVLPHKKN